jgi:hypothetical protein
MVDKKKIFISYSIKDKRQKNLLKRQSLNTISPFEYIDMFIKEPYDSDWKNRVQTLIHKSDGVIVLVSENSLISDGQKWELICAKQENKKTLGIRSYTRDRTIISIINTKKWTWSNISDFIDIL